MATISATLGMMNAIIAPAQRSIIPIDRLAGAMGRLDCGNVPAIAAAFAQLRIEINEAGQEADKLEEKLNRMNLADGYEKWAAKAFGGLKNAAKQGVEYLQQGWRALSVLGTRSDERTGVDTRLGLVVDDNHTPEGLEAQVMAAADRSHASYGDTAALVTQLGQQDVFEGNNNAAVAFAEILNKAAAVSGTPAADAQGVVQQLAQGFSDGSLQGEGLNSIMKDTPILAEMMCASLNVTKEELRNMAYQGQLTADVVAGSIMRQRTALDEQFNGLPMTFGQAMTLLENKASGFMDRLSQPGQAVDILVTKLSQLSDWANTPQGVAFFDSMAAGVTAVVEAIAWLAQKAGETYTFIAENWPDIEPIFWGLVTAVGALVAAYFICKGLTLALAAAEGVKAAASLLQAAASGTATVAQLGLNASLLACPITWIVLGLGLLIAALVAVTLWVIHLWRTNIDFKVNVIQTWNSILNFFDQVPVFFMGIAYGIADAFSNANILIVKTMEMMVNAVISGINDMINALNTLPGVSIKTIGKATFGAEFAADEMAKQAGRAASLADAKAKAAEKAAERERKLAEDERQWRAEAAAREQAAKQQEEERKKKSEAEGDIEGLVPFKPMGGGPGGEGNPPFGPAGGSLDKAGKLGGEVDISNQSIEYLRDIAEIQALARVNAYTHVSYDISSSSCDESIYKTVSDVRLNPADAELLRYPASAQSSATVSYEEMDETRLNPMDAGLLRSNAGGDANVYYLSYTGGVRIRNDVKKGESWEEIRKSIYDEAQADIETGLSGIEEVVFG